MPKNNLFDEKIEDIYKKFMKNKFNQKMLDKRKYKIYYHCHPNKRFKKMVFIYANPIQRYGRESGVPFFIVSVNKIKKDNKEKYICCYNDFFVGGYKEFKLNFTTKEDEKGIKKNIKESYKIIKIIKLAFNNLQKELKKNPDFYKQ